MKKHLSKWGIFGALLYIAAVVWSYWYSQTCLSAFCGIGFLLVVMPWAIFLDFLGLDIFSLNFVGLLLILLNIFMIYLLFAFFEHLFRKDKKYNH